jgi:hypothetical protein
MFYLDLQQNLNLPIELARFQSQKIVKKIAQPTICKK